jgi:flagellar motor switch protein FliN/FliY
MKIRESATSEKTAGYLQACVENVCRSVEARATVVVAAAKLVADDHEADLAELAERGVWMRFTVSAAGEQAFLLSSEDALKLARVLSKEPPESPVALGQNQLDGLIALFTQAAAATARSLVARLGREVSLEFAGSQRPAWTPAARATFQLVVSPNPPVFLTLQVSPELVDVLESIGGDTATTASEVEAPPASPAATEPSCDTNIDLLMDVELEVSLRFGERKLLLKEVLELGPGSLIELDQEVQDPVELLVGKRVVARGDVVIVDGNYGLRVTEIASPSERIESLRK